MQKEENNFQIEYDIKKASPDTKKKKIICLIAISCVKLKLSNVSAAIWGFVVYFMPMPTR